MNVSLKNVSIARTNRPLLSGVNLNLSAGDALVLRGPNGLGKTTLLRCIAGLQPPLRGEITIDPDQIIYAAHSDGIKSMLTCRENLLFWAQVFGHEKIDAALEAFELEGLSDRLAGKLSAGQKRRLGLARLLVGQRKIWVLDEPTVSLDAHCVALFAAVVQAHLSAGGMAIIATHIELGLKEAQVVDLSQFIAQAQDMHGSSDEAFL